jgi:hypothetical protein
MVDKTEALLTDILTRMENLEKGLPKMHPNLEIKSTAEQLNEEESLGDQIMTTPLQQNAPTPSRDESVQKSVSQDDEKEEEEGRPLPQCGPATPINYITAASSILSWKSVRKIIGDVVHDDETKDPDYTTTREATQGVFRHYGIGKDSNHGFHKVSAHSRDTPASGFCTSTADPSYGKMSGISRPDLSLGTVSRRANLYMKHVNMRYPILFPTQLNCLIQGFMKTRDVSNTTSKLNYIEYARTAQLKRKRSVEQAKELHHSFVGSEAPQSSIERALVLVILSLGNKFDHDLPPEYEGSSSGSATFRYGYPSPKM